MKKIFVIALALLLLLCAFGCKKENNVTDKTGEKTKVEEDSREKFTQYQMLTARFMEYCQSGNVEGMYSLYYDNRLEKTYNRISDKISKQEFEALLKEEMSTVYSYREFEYGCAEMPDMSSPLSYVNQFLYNSGSEVLNLPEAKVTNCVNLRVYKEGEAYPSDYMMICTDGLWYIVG